MKKTVTYALIAALVLLIAGTLAYAAAPEQSPQQRPNGQWSQGPALTDDQKQQLAPLYNQMVETQKKISQKYVDFGYITQWQADQRSARMQERVNYMIQNGFVGPMMGGGRGGPGMMGGGRGPGFGPNGGRGGCGQQQAPAPGQQ